MSVDAAIGELAERQHGRVARRQVAALGLSASAIDRRIRTKRLIPVHQGVYAVGCQLRSLQSAWMAAVLAGGAGAVLSHRAAAAHWGIAQAGSGAVDVTTPRGQHARRGIRFHRSNLPADEITVHNGIPITTLPRTLLDMAAGLDVGRLERAINEAEIRQLWDELSLVDLLHRYPRRRGAKTARAALQRRNAGATLSKSDLEALFLDFAERHGLPRPQTNVLVDGCAVDCVWPEQRLVIEVDGWETHKTRAAFERDREKSRILQAAGWRCVPVTYLHLRDGSQAVARDVRRMLGATV
jgi:very-short-patch-repair endonuclease